VGTHSRNKGTNKLNKGTNRLNKGTDNRNEGTNARKRRLNNLRVLPREPVGDGRAGARSRRDGGVVVELLYRECERRRQQRLVIGLLGGAAPLRVLAGTARQTEQCRHHSTLWSAQQTTDKRRRRCAVRVWARKHARAHEGAGVRVRVCVGSYTRAPVCVHARVHE
jgi:hypothetical protein